MDGGEGTIDIIFNLGNKDYSSFSYCFSYVCFTCICEKFFFSLIKKKYIKFTAGYLTI